uniref:Uncharacterized protein n=1 Tax=Lophosiphonia teges TaxID=2007110 RepID=A0A1Z1MV45_9FLOR|nr:hypothetical protein [Polysiphonia teges]
MIRYWPTQQSIYLNNTIVDLFVETEKKIVIGTSNQSSQHLYLDIFNTKTRVKLFKQILNEFKKLILDIIEIDLKPQKIKKLRNTINKIFINRVCTRFLLTLNSINTKPSHEIILTEDDEHLTEYLIIYIIFGSSYVEDNIFLFESFYTPYNHVKILLENFIIQTCNYTVKELISDLKSSPNINKFLKTKNICNKLYTSNRSIILFINNLKLQNLIKYYIYEVKSFYNERQQVWIMSSVGIITKYIYVSRIKKIKKLNQINTIFILWLEIKDLLVPRSEKLIIQVSKYFLYCSINLLSNLILILIKVIVLYFNN